MPKTFNLTLIRSKAAQAVGFKQAMQVVNDISNFKTISVQTSQRKMPLTSTHEIGMLEEFMLESMIAAGIDINNVRVEMNSDAIILEKLSN